jgi:hypothetical protein
MSKKISHSSCARRAGEAKRTKSAQWSVRLEEQIETIGDADVAAVVIAKEVH